ncbi:MAG TPA: IS1595 family transposase, partial [Acidobacteriaceae bacterium]
NGIPKQSFHLFLCECEWRFNTPSPKQQQNQLLQLVKNTMK